MKISALLTAALIVGGAAATPALAISPAVEFASSSPLTDDRVFTLGYSFALSSAVTVDALGYWDNGRGNNHQVAIWDSAGTLITSTTVLGTDPIVGNFVWGSIAPVVLAAGRYVIGGEFLGDGTFNALATGVVTIPEYTYGEVRYDNANTGFNFPTLTSGGYGDNGILEVSFSVTDVPEPASWALMIAGFGMVGFAMRRRTLATA